MSCTCPDPHTLATLQGCCLACAEQRIRRVREYESTGVPFIQALRLTLLDEHDAHMSKSTLNEWAEAFPLS